MEVEGEQRETMTSNKVMCLLTDPEGTHLGAPMYLPQDAGPQQLQQMVNKLLNNVSFIDFGPFCCCCCCCVAYVVLRLVAEKVQEKKIELMSVVELPFLSNYQAWNFYCPRSAPSGC